MKKYVTCDADGCDETSVLPCECGRCRREPPLERFHACGGHKDAVRDRHLAVRGKEPEWPLARIDTKTAKGYGDLIRPSPKPPEAGPQVPRVVPARHVLELNFPRDPTLARAVETACRAFDAAVARGVRHGGLALLQLAPDHVLVLDAVLCLVNAAGYATRVDVTAHGTFLVAWVATRPLPTPEEVLAATETYAVLASDPDAQASGRRVKAAPAP